jgi:hypothetical protein
LLKNLFYAPDAALIPIIGDTLQENVIYRDTAARILAAAGNSFPAKKSAPEDIPFCPALNAVAD